MNNQTSAIRLQASSAASFNCEVALPRLYAQRNHRAVGFSLVEVLIAMGIFAVGFIAVASMFPAAIILQKQTVIDVESQIVSRNASAMIRGRKMTFHASDMNADVYQGLPSMSVSLKPLESAIGAANFRWSLSDRSYPTAVADVEARRYYWVPLMRKTKDPAENTGDFLVTVFILKREAGKIYQTTLPTGAVWGNPTSDAALDYVPKVIGIPVTIGGAGFQFDNDSDNDGTIPDQVRPGDFVADNNGIPYFVTSATPTDIGIFGQIAKTQSGPLKIWYGLPASITDGTPTTRVLLLSGVVSDYVP
jgi:type II secretory pathway pseudopilin PulG